MTETIHMMRDLLLVRKIAPKLITSGGIWIPGQVDDDRPLFWDVLVVGKKCIDVKPGDKIVTFKHTGGQDLKWNGEDCQIIRYKNIGCVFECDMMADVY